MKTVLALGSLVALLAGPRLPSAAAGEPKAKPPQPTVKLGKIPDVKLAPRPAVGQNRAKRVKELIADLANLDGASVGLSATLRGHDFAPVAGQSHVGALLLTDHRLRPSQTFRALVALGPDALPHLLDALDDKTPTKVTIKHEGLIGGMWSGGELDLNPVNPAEAAVYRSRPGRRNRGNGFESYTVTVGDVCFVAVGQIVGRSYSAVRYQPTACVVINNPAYDAKLRADVRAVWAGKDPARRLFDSLLADYATEGVFNGTSLDGWYAGSDRQCAAALRLLYYFPRESAPLIAGRLGKLDVGRGDSMLQSVANGARAEYFIKAVSWCNEPAVRAALTAVFKRAEEQCDVLAALPAIDDVKLIHERLEPLVDKRPPDDSPYYQGHVLLSAFVGRTPGTTKPVLQKYLRGAGTERCLTACAVLREVAVAWDAEVLGPLLEDRRETRRTYPVGREGKGPSLPERVCDAAAETLAQNHPELKFALAGGHAGLNKQIAVMRKQLDSKK